MILPGAWMGLRLARTRDRRHTWRRWSIPLGAAVLTLALLVGWAVIADARAAEERGLARRPVLASGEPAPVRIALRAATWQGRQIPVVWVDAQPGAPVPPGLSAWPPAGQAVVSPAVAEDAALVGALGLTLAGVGSGAGGTIGTEGLVSPSERLIYQAMPPSRELEFGEGIPVADFGPQSADTPQVVFDTDSPIPAPPTMTALVVWLVLIPAGMLALSTAWAMSEVRVERTRVLQRLGLSQWQLLGVNATETLALAAPGSAVAAAVLWGCGDRLHPRLGDLSLSQDALDVSAPTAMLAVMSVVAFFSVAGAPLSAGIPMGHGPAGPNRPRWWLTAPLAVAGAGMAAARIWRDPLLLLAALALMTIALPLAIPWIVGRLAGVGSRARPVTLWLASRRLAASPTRFARPAVAVGVLLFVVISWAGTYLNSVTGKLDEPDAPTDRSYFSVTWRDPGEADLAAARQALPTLALAPVDLGSAPPAALFGTCSEVLQFLPEASCADGLTPDLEQDFGARFGVRAHISDAAPEHGRLAAVLVAAPPGTTYTDLAGRLGTRFPALNIDQLSQITLAAPFLASWLALMGAVATTLLLLAAVHTFGNRVLALAPEDARMSNAGADFGQVITIQRWTVIAPLLVSVVLGTAAGLGFQVIATPLDQSVVTLGAAGALAALAGTIAAAAAVIVLRLPRAGHQHRGAVVDTLVR